jgi:hypothetical protein
MAHKTRPRDPHFYVIARLDRAIQGHKEPLWLPLDATVKPWHDN